MPVKNQNLSIPQLKSKLVSAADQSRKSMAELLYWLREKLKAQGKRNDLRRKKEGFQVWCEANLGISRRTADRWADDWAYANNKKAKPKPKKPTSRHGDHKLDDRETGPPKITFNLPLLVNEGQHEELLWFVEIIGEDEVTRLVYETLKVKATELEGQRPADPFQLPPSKPAASANVKEQAVGRA